MKSPTPVDVLVLGLGPAGATAAMAAAQAGCTVIAVDRKAEAGVPVQCAEFVPGLLSFKTPEVATAQCQAIGSMMTLVESQASDHTPDFRGSMISRADFDRQLVALASKKGARCEFGTAVRSITETGDVMLAGGGIMRPRVIVGADGPRSLAGAAIGQVNTECVDSRQISVRLVKPHTATDIFLSAGIPGGYAWLFPKRDLANLGVGVAPRARALLKPLLEELHRKLAREGRVDGDILGFTGGLIPVGGMLRPAGTVGAVHVLLAGDAAGLTNPITGAGINAAVQSGEMAGAAAAALVGGEEKAAQDYAEELEGLFSASLARALRRRQSLMRIYETGHMPQPADLRAAWIAYPEYWAA